MSSWPTIDSVEAASDECPSQLSAVRLKPGSSGGGEGVTAECLFIFLLETLGLTGRGRQPAMGRVERREGGRSARGGRGQRECYSYCTAWPGGLLIGPIGVPRWSRRRRHATCR